MIGNWLLWQEHEHESDGKTNLFIFNIYFLVVVVDDVDVVVEFRFSNRFCRACVFTKIAEVDLFTVVFALVKNISTRCGYVCSLLAILINSSLIEEVWVCLPDSQTCQKVGADGRAPNIFRSYVHVCCKLLWTGLWIQTICEIRFERARASTNATKH